MPVTLTVKQVPERLAQKLRARAAANHRSLQGELLLILTEAVGQQQPSPLAAEPESPAYRIKPAAEPPAAHGKRLTLHELWERARRIAAQSPSESAAIVRKSRDDRHRR